METQKAAYYQAPSPVCLAPCISSLRRASCHPGSTLALDGYCWATAKALGPGGHQELLQHPVGFPLLQRVL